MLAGQFFAEAVVDLFADEMVALGLVEVAGGVEDTVRPQGDFAVVGVAGEEGALADEGTAEAQATGRGVDEEEAETGGSAGFFVFDEEDGADGFAVALGDPAALAGGVEVVDEVGGDMGDEGLEALVPAVLAGVEEAMTLDDPAHVSGAMGAEDEGWSGGRWREDCLDGRHRLDEMGALHVGEGSNHLLDLFVGALVEGGEFFLSGFGEGEERLPCVDGRCFAGDEFSVDEGAKDPAEIAEVEVECGGDLGCSGLSVGGDLVEDAGFGEREGALQEVFFEGADRAGIEAVEASDGDDVGIGGHLNF